MMSTAPSYQPAATTGGATTALPLLNYPRADFKARTADSISIPQLPADTTTCAADSISTPQLPADFEARTADSIPTSQLPADHEACTAYSIPTPQLPADHKANSVDSTFATAAATVGPHRSWGAWGVYS